MHSAEKGYRPDIDGLRAISVLAVLIFHARNSWLPGGFIGVDVFFVISGFLISSHIFTGVENRTFSYLDFYRRRINRILPAFYGVIILTIIAAAFLYLPSDFERAARSAARGLTFQANSYFAEQDDYFARSTAEYPLLNLWSLSVEEQFYLVLPTFALLVLCHLKSRGKQAVVTGAIFASVIYAEYLIAHGESQLAYYSTATRACELLVGTWLATARLRLDRSKELVGFLGALTMMASFVFVSGESHFPGILCLLPCIGAAGVIAAGENSYIGRLLSWGPLVFVGLISYSLYLYHWPIMAITRYINADNSFGLLETISMFVLSFTCAILSWHYVEKPFRKSHARFRRVFLARFLIPSIAALAALAIFTRTHGLPQRYGNDQTYVAQTLTFAGYCYEHFDTTENCRFGDRSQPAKVLLVGDSYAGQYQATFDEIGKAQGFAFYARALGGCFPLVQIPGQDFVAKMRSDCEDQLHWTEKAAQSVDTIVFSGRWGRLKGLPSYNDFIAYLEKSVNFLHSQHKNVIFLEGTPVCPGIQKYYRQRFSLVQNLFPLSELYNAVQNSCSDLEAQNNADIEAFANSHGARFLKIVAPYLEAHSLPFQGERLLYYDDEHLNETGALELGRFLAGSHPEIKSILLPKPNF